MTAQLTRPVQSRCYMVLGLLSHQRKRSVSLSYLEITVYGTELAVELRSEVPMVDDDSSEL